MIAATIVSMFSLLVLAGSIACGMLPRGMPIRYPLAMAGMFVALAPARCSASKSAGRMAISRRRFRFRIGAVLTLLPIAWADYSAAPISGAIRGIAAVGAGLGAAAGRCCPAR